MAARFGGGSYLSPSDPRLHFGLGPARKVDRVEVTWPSGRRDCYQGLAADAGYRLREGDPAPKPLPGFARIDHQAMISQRAQDRGGPTASEDELVGKTSQRSGVFCCYDRRGRRGHLGLRVGGDRPLRHATRVRPRQPAPLRPSAVRELAAAPSAADFRMLRDRLDDDAEEPDLLSKQTEPSPFRFAEIAREAGIDFVHVSGMTEEKHFPTANGSGVAIFDYDGDGQLDLYFATGTLLPLGYRPEGPEPAVQEPGRRTRSRT